MDSFSSMVIVAIRLCDTILESIWQGKQTCESGFLNYGINQHFWVPWVGISVTRFGDLLDLWQLFKAIGNNQFSPISPILRQIFVKVSKSFIFLVKPFLGDFYRHLAIFIWSHWWGLPGGEFFWQLGKAWGPTKSSIFHLIGKFLNFVSSGLLYEKLAYSKNWPPFETRKCGCQIKNLLLHVCNL